MNHTRDRLQFFASSADKAPGKGAGEHLAHPSQYAELAAIPHWRRVLSNFHVCPFVYRGRTYRTIEHAFQAAKIRLADPAAADRFTVESQTELGRGDGLNARKARKMVVLRAADILRWDTTSASVMAEIARKKFAACPDALRVLRLTRDAELWHAAPRMKAVRFKHLELIRSGDERGGA